MTRGASRPHALQDGPEQQKFEQQFGEQEQQLVELQRRLADSEMGIVAAGEAKEKVAEEARRREQELTTRVANLSGELSGAREVLRDANRKAQEAAAEAGTLASQLQQALLVTLDDRFRYKFRIIFPLSSS